MNDEVREMFPHRPRILYFLFFFFSFLDKRLSYRRCEEKITVVALALRATAKAKATSAYFHTTQCALPSTALGRHCVLFKCARAEDF